MQKDPRYRNQTFNQETIRTYLTDYAVTLRDCLGSIPQESLDAASHLLLKTRESGGRVFAAGNGGSAAISEHLGCDWQKGVHLPGHLSLKVNCLTSNTALLTAISNDFGYDQSFSFQLELADLKPDDLMVLISSSGNSENIVKAATYAKDKSCKVIGLSGFSGGKLKDLADVSLHVPYDNYGLVEDAHQVVMHVLAQFHDLTYRKRI